MKKHDISNQFLIFKQLVSQDLIGVDGQFNITKDSFFKQLQLIEDRNLFTNVQVYENICGINAITKDPICNNIPKLNYSIVDGAVVISPIMESIVSHNEWVPTVTNILGFESILKKLDTLQTASQTFVDKMDMSGIEYIVQADMAKQYVCNSLSVMRGVGNLFLQIVKGKFLAPSYTGNYDTITETNLVEFVAAELMKKGFIFDHTSSVANIDDCLLIKYIDFFNDFLIQLTTFNTHATDQDKIAFLTSPAYDANGDGLFCLNYLKEESLKKHTEILELMDEKINLLELATEFLDGLNSIIKIVSTVAIVLNTSGEANNLQKELVDQQPDFSDERLVAIRYAMDEKWNYSANELGKALKMAVRKTVNEFDYYNRFEHILDVIFEQGVPQYDQVPV